MNKVSLKEWALFYERCLDSRLRAEKFDVFSSALYARSPLPGGVLAELFIRPRKDCVGFLDPLIAVYLDRLFVQGRISSADILRSTFSWSRDGPAKRPATGEQLSAKEIAKAALYNAVELDEIILHRMLKAFIHGEAPKDENETRMILRILPQWMQSIVSNHTSDSMMQAMTGAVQAVQMKSFLVREAMGLLMLGVLESAKVTEFLNSANFRKADRKLLSSSLSSYITFLAQSSIQTANRLKAYQDAHGLLEDPISEIASGTGLNESAVNAIQLQAVHDLPAINARAGLYVFLNALLTGRPLTDDTVILGYLQVRYKGDVQSLTVDLITASFDILSNSMYRNESSQTMTLLKSFLNNKLPILLTILQTQMLGSALTAEFCITQALSHVDPNAFPSFSQAFDISSGSNVLQDVRQDFLFACALHRLIPVESIERLLGEPPMATLPESGKYAKEQLVVQCTANSEKVEELLKQIDAMDGNAAAIVAAVTEVIHNHCSTRDSMSLKNISNYLSKRPQALDVILQFTSPASMLQPLCHLLDAWRYEEDQGEYTPVYDEFGAILLLVLTVVHRYDLTYYELGLSSDSFVSRYLERGHHNIPLSELTPDQDKQLGQWLKGLFSPDSGDGVSDDLMSSCQPQEFYLLVPTLFQQIVLGCSSDQLSLDAVKSGLEYVLETFLLPSLVGAITWMTSYALEQAHKDTPYIIQILNKVIRPASISGDSQAMHSTIISIVGRRLDVCLRTLQRRGNMAQELQPMLERIKPNLNFERTVSSPIAELETWTATPGNTLRLSIRHAVSSLVVWSTAASIHLAPPSYTHRLFYASMKILGATAALSAILDEVKAQTEAGNGSVALDVATAIISAPLIDNSPIHVGWVRSPVPAPQLPRTQANFRDILTVRFNEAADLMSSDPLMAESIVRLHRRVEAQLAVSTLPDISAQPLGMEGMEIDVSDPAVAAAAAAVAGGLEQQPLDTMDLTADSTGGLGALGMGMDMDTTGLSLDMSNIGTDGAGDLSAGGLGDLSGVDMGMDDVFGGLEMDPDLNF